MGEYSLVALEDALEEITNKINEFELVNADYKNNKEWLLMKAKQEYIEKKMKSVQEIEEIFKGV